MSTNPPHSNKAWHFAVATAFSCFSVANATPIGPHVIAGTASLAQSGSTLNITSSNGSILNWQSFNIGQNATTNFIQPSSSSVVINRVSTEDPSAIFGSLSSNGRVFLVTPSGKLWDKNGLVADTEIDHVNSILSQLQNNGYVIPAPTVSSVVTGAIPTILIPAIEQDQGNGIRFQNKRTTGGGISVNRTSVPHPGGTFVAVVCAQNCFLVDQSGAITGLASNDSYGLSEARVRELLAMPLLADDFFARGTELITTKALSNSLNQKKGVDIGLVSLGTIMHGAHSRPLSHRVDVNKNSVWIAGDWGTDKHGKRDGTLGFGEIGLGHNFGPAQLNISVGQTWNRQNLDLSGRAEIDGNYIYTEALIPTVNNFWLTLSAQAAFGNASLRRGYITGINTWDSSTGNADQNAWGVRLRLDWENALRLDNANVTPYLDATYSKSKLDAYAESGGSFPASFEARTDKSTELRLGLNADYPLTGSLRLLGTVEAIHRFEKTSSNIRGQVPGIVSFDIVGQTNERNWERFGIGIEDKLAGGIASIYLNVTTKGETPNAWLAASWKWAF